MLDILYVESCVLVMTLDHTHEVIIIILSNKLFYSISTDLSKRWPLFWLLIQAFLMTSIRFSSELTLTATDFKISPNEYTSLKNEGGWVPRTIFGAICLCFSWYNCCSSNDSFLMQACVTSIHFPKSIRMAW